MSDHLRRSERDGEASRGAAEGVEHLQRAAREMIAAARSFLDAVEHVVEDRAALEEVTSTVSGLAGGVVDALRGRQEPWAAAAWEPDAPTDAAAPDADPGERPGRGDDTAGGGDDTADAPGDDTADGGDDTEDWARPLVDRDAPRRPSRVRRISVE